MVEIADVAALPEEADGSRRAHRTKDGGCGACTTAIPLQRNNCDNERSGRRTEC